MTMMMWTLTKVIIILSASMGFIAGIGFFPLVIYTPPHGPATNYSIGDVEDLTASTEPGIGDYFAVIVTWAIASVVLMMSIIVAIVFLFPFLIWIFHMPIGLAVLLQGVIYIQYAIGYIQFKSNRAIKLME